MKQNLKDEVKKKKIVALKSIAKEEDEDDEESKKEDDDEEMALITHKFRRFMRMKRPNFKRKPFSKGEASKDWEKNKDKKQPTCFEYKKLGHFKIDYPLLKKSSKKVKKKAMMATWNNSEDSGSDEEE